MGGRRLRRVGTLSARRRSAQRLQCDDIVRETGGRVDSLVDDLGGPAPAIAGLVLGYLSRTGRVAWQIGHGANVVLRQLGILMFLACAGLGSGTAFADAVVAAAGSSWRVPAS